LSSSFVELRFADLDGLPTLGSPDTLVPEKIMIKRRDAMALETRERMRDGAGSVEILHVFAKENLRGRARLFARLKLGAGSSIGYHVHDREEEVFYILSGKGKVTEEDGKSSDVGPGDAVLTGNGGGHSIENTGSESLEILAVILPF
jgi:mannose-6-phosphate isomerase-like protein (cupin superfamily)